MTVQILRKKFTVRQYHQMIESGILADRDHPHGRGRVSLPRAICLTAKQIPCNVQLMMLMTVAILHWARRPRPYPLGLAILHWARRPRPYGDEI